MGALEYLVNLKVAAGGMAELDLLGEKLAAAQKSYEALDKLQVSAPDVGGTDKLDKLKNQLTELEGLYSGLPKNDNLEKNLLPKDLSGLDQVKDKLKDVADPKTKDELSSAFATLKEAGGPVGKLGEALEGLSKKFKLATSSALGAVAVVVTTVLQIVMAIGQLSAKLTEFAFKSADANRSFMIELEGVTGSAAGAADAAASIDSVAARSALGRDKIREFGKALADAGLSGTQFSVTLKEIANVAAVKGPDAGKKFQEIVTKSKDLGKFKVDKEGLSGIGLTMEDLAKALGMSVDTMKAKMASGAISVDAGIDAMNAAVDKKFGGLAARKAMSLDAQLLKLKESFAKLFESPELAKSLEGLLAAIQDVLSVFSQGTAGGQGLKLIMTEVFSALFNLAAKVGPYVKAFIQGMIAGLLIVYIVVKRAVSVFQELFGGDLVSKGSLIKLAFYAGAGAVGVLITALGILAGVLGFMAFMMLAPFLPLLFTLAPIIALIMLVYFAFQALRGVAAMVGEAIRAAFRSVAAEVLAVVAEPLGALERGWDRIVAAVQAAVAKIRNALMPFWIMFQTGASIVVAGVTGAFARVWEMISNGASIVFGAVSGVMSSIWNTIANAASGAFATIAGIFMSIAEAILGPLSGIDLTSIAINLINGFVNGILSGIGMVAEAVASIASTAMGILTSILGIASPSKVFAELGGHTAAGFAEGIDGGSDQTSAAVAKMVDVPEAGGKGGKGGKSGGAVRIDQINIYGRDAEDIWQQLEEKLTSLLERIELSGPEPSGAS